MAKKAKPVKSLSELRYKMAEKMADFENGEITAGDGKVFVGFGSVIINSFKVEQFNNVVSGVTKGIDFLIEPPKGKDPFIPNTGGRISGQTLGE